MNKLEISGKVHSEVSVYCAPSGLVIMNFKLFIEEQTEKEGKNFITVAAYGKIAEKYRNSIKKGSKILISGKLDSRQYTTIDGEHKTTIEVTAENIEIL